MSEEIEYIVNIDTLEVVEIIDHRHDSTVDEIEELETSVEDKKEVESSTQQTSSIQLCLFENLSDITFNSS